MDLNSLYHRRGKSLLMAAQASSDASRDAHLSLARDYFERISDTRRALFEQAA